MREQQAPQELCRTSPVSIPPDVRDRCLHAMLNLSREIRAAADLRKEISSQFSPAPLPEPFLEGLKRKLAAEVDIVRRNNSSSRSWRIWAPFAAACVTLLTVLGLMLSTDAPVETIHETEVSMFSLNTPILTAQGVVPVRVSVRRMYTEPGMTHAESAKCRTTDSCRCLYTDTLTLDGEDNTKFHRKVPNQMIIPRLNEVI